MVETKSMTLEEKINRLREELERLQEVVSEEDAEIIEVVLRDTDGSGE